MEASHPLTDDDARFVAGLFCTGIKPDLRRTVAEWADARRIVTEGAAEGRWNTALTPYQREPMEKFTLSNPARRVTIMGSAQVGKTQVGLNFLGQVLEETPTKVLVVLPSLNAARMYNRDKLDPMLQAEGLRETVADITSRDGTGSTTTVKRGARGAQVEIVTASSSKDLQSRTVRALLCEEVTEYPRDVDKRGDPVDLAYARTLAWRKRGEKVGFISTPGIKGDCRITRFYEEGSRAKFHVPCPHCGHIQELVFANLAWPADRPESAAYLCAGDGCGALIEERHKPALLAAGDWVHERPELAARTPSYHINALYSPFMPWAEIAREQIAATANPTKAKAFSQQLKGEPWDVAFDLPKADILLLRRDRWQPGQVPPQVLFLIGATDVQGDRLVWAVWGFDRHFGMWLIDTGIIEGDPTLPQAWQEHDTLLSRRWTDAWGKPRAPESWGIDSGYLSSHVYAYARRHAARAEPRIRALDGRDKWKLPPLGTPKMVDVDWQGKKIGSVALWPVGTWDMKSELAGALRLTEQGPGPDGWPAGAVRFNETIDRAWLDELLAEYCAEDPRTGARKWVKITARNEAWDLAVYCRAQARHETMQFDEARWNRLAAERLGPPADVQPDLATLWAPDLHAVTAEPPAPPKPEAPHTPPAAFIPRRTGWIPRGGTWLR